MAFRAGRVEVELGADLQRRDFDLYEKKLKEVRQLVAKKEQFQAQLGGDFNPRAFNAYQRELKRTEHSMNDNVKAHGRLRTSFGSVYAKGGALFAAAGSLYGLQAGFKAVIGAAEESIKVQKQTEAVLKSTGGQAGVTADHVANLATKLSKLVGVDDEVIQQGENVLLTFTNVRNEVGKGNDIFDRATGLALDMSKALGTDLQSANIQLGKALNDPIKGITALQRVGVSFTKQQKEQIGTLIEHGKRTEAQRLILRELRKEFGGTGEATANASDKFKVALGNLEEQIGKALLPTVEDITKKATLFVEQMQDGTGQGGRFVEKLKDIWKWTKKVVDAFADFVTFAAKNFRTFVRRVREDIDMIIGWFTGLEDAMLAISEAGEKLPLVGGKFKGLSDQIRRSRDRLNDFREEIRPTGHEFDGLGDDVSKLNRRLSSDRGTKAAGKNFKSLKNTVARHINDAVSDTDKGMGRIRLSLSRALRDIGDTKGLKSIGGTSGDIAAGLNKTANRAVGGWIGAPGMIGGDIVPAMLAPGEAVLNRHQQAIVEGLLGEGFLDRLFAAVDRPHYFATGGRAGGGLMGANPGLAGYASLASQFGLRVTSGLRPGSITSSGNISLHSSGNAIDVDAGSPGAMLAYAKAMAARFGSGLDELIHTPLGFGIKNGRRVPPYAVADHYDHVHVGDRTPSGGLGGVLEQLMAPQVSGSGALRAIAQGAINRFAKGANNRLSDAFGSMGIPASFDTGGAKSAGGQYGKSQLAGLWRRAGGPENIANLMAAIALAESGGNPRAHNPSGASGLWQILGVPFPGNVYDPLTNARMAVAKYGSQGLGAWEAYTNGTYRQYLSRGGRAMQFFARGGRAGSKRKKIKKPSAAAKARDYIRPLASLNTDRVGEYDAIIGHVDDWNTRYGIAERTYDLDVEELIKDDGSIDEGAIRERANELLSLISIRQQIIRQLVGARKIARRVIRTYNNIINRLRRSLKHAGKKSRASIRETIGTYTERRDEWRGKLHELEISTLPSARLDLRELVRERGEVLGTKAEPQEPGEEPTPEEPTPEEPAPETTPPSPADIAAAALADLSAFTQGRQELLSGYARNFITAFQAGSPGGVFSGSPDELSRAAGVRFFGAGSTGSSLGGATIINNYNQLPSDIGTWSSQMRFQLEAA